MSIPRGYVGHERDLLKGQCFPDPKIRHGAFRVLPRTDGKFIVFDDVTKTSAEGTASFPTIAAAEYAAKQLFNRDRRPDALALAREAS